MKQLHETEVDGVRCFWVDSGRPTMAGSLMFRVGMVDEPLRESGWIHLLEHMALHGRGGGVLGINGSVSLLATTFDCHGPVDEVAAHLRRTAAWLSHPELEDLDREKGVLRAESRTRGGMSTDALVWRYGAQGPGLAGLEEFGVGRATKDRLADLAGRVFTRTNAVLVLDGPPPTGLAFDLEEGVGRHAAPTAQPCENVFPGAYVDYRGLAISGTSERSVAGTFVAPLIERAMREKFRNEHGGAYAPWCHYEPVDEQSAVVLAGTDLDPKLKGYAVHASLEIIDDLVTDGPDPAALTDLVEQISQSMNDPYNTATFAWRAANAVLMGRDPESPDEVLAEIRSVEPSAIAEAAAAVRSTLLIGAPEGANRPTSVPLLVRPMTERVDGRSFRHQDWPGNVSTLVIGRDVVQVAQGTTGAAVARQDVVGLLTYEDGGRTLVADDAWNLFLEPAEWRDGPAALQLLDAWIPPELHLPQPARVDVQAPARMSARRRWWIGLRRILATRHVVWAVVLLAGIGAGVALAYGRVFPAIILGIFMYRVVKQLRAPRDAEPPGG